MEIRPKQPTANALAERLTGDAWIDMRGGEIVEIRAGDTIDTPLARA